MKINDIVSVGSSAVHGVGFSSSSSCLCPVLYHAIFHDLRFRYGCWSELVPVSWLGYRLQVLPRLELARVGVVAFSFEQAASVLSFSLGVLCSIASST